MCVSRSFMARTLASSSGRFQPVLIAGIRCAGLSAVPVVIQPNVAVPLAVPVTQYNKNVAKATKSEARGYALHSPRYSLWGGAGYFFGVADASWAASRLSTLPNSSTLLPYVAQSPLRCAVIASR